MASIEKLKNRIIAPDITNSTSSSDDMDDKNSVSDHDKRSLSISDNILEINEAQDIPQATFLKNIENERKEGVNNENI